MSTETKRPVEDIVEQALDGLPGMAFTLNQLQVDAANFLDQFREGYGAGVPLAWDVIDYHGIPRDLCELLQKLVDYDIRL